MEEKQIQEVNAGIYCVNWNKVKKSFTELKSNNAQGEYYLTDIILPLPTNLSSFSV